MVSAVRVADHILSGRKKELPHLIADKDYVPAASATSEYSVFREVLVSSKDDEPGDDREDWAFHMRMRQHHTMSLEPSKKTVAVPDSTHQMIGTVRCLADIMQYAAGILTQLVRA